MPYLVFEVDFDFGFALALDLVLGLTFEVVLGFDFDLGIALALDLALALGLAFEGVLAPKNSSISGSSSLDINSTHPSQANSAVLVALVTNEKAAAIIFTKIKGFVLR